MKLVTAIVKPFVLEDVKGALEQIRLKSIHVPPHIEILYEIIRTRIECQYEMQIGGHDSYISGRAEVRLIIKP